MGMSEKLDKNGSQTPSQRSGSTDENHKHEFIENENGGDEPQEETSPKKTWLQKLNPFLAGEIPPVPTEDAGLVPDLKANWWGKLTWGWMGPLMLVRFSKLTSLRHYSSYINTGCVRLGISDRYRKKICGITMKVGGPKRLQINLTETSKNDVKTQKRNPNGFFSGH